MNNFEGLDVMKIEEKIDCLLDHFEIFTVNQKLIRDKSFGIMHNENEIIVKYKSKIVNRELDYLKIRIYEKEVIFYTYLNYSSNKTIPKKYKYSENTQGWNRYEILYKFESFNEFEDAFKKYVM